MSKVQNLKRFFLYAWQNQRIASLVFCVALALFIHFSVDFVSKAIHFGKQANIERPLELWMPPRYVQYSWGFEISTMFEIFDLDPETPLSEVPSTIGAYLQETGLTLEELQGRVDAAKEVQRAGQDQ